MQLFFLFGSRVSVIGVGYDLFCARVKLLSPTAAGNILLYCRRCGKFGRGRAHSHAEGCVF